MREKTELSNAHRRQRYEAELAAAHLERPLNPKAKLPEQPPTPGRVSEVVSLLARTYGFRYSPVSVNEDSPALTQVVQALD